MAKPRVFVSSTYYDLKHIRASLEAFITELGYDPVLSERGHIPYAHDRPLDESCYSEVDNSHIYVLIVGGSYGSEISATKDSTDKPKDHYESITKREYETAARKDLPIYVLIEKSVYAEYRTFEKNRANKDIVYAHVNRVDVFHFIEEILTKKRNNPIHTFERFADIKEWLREQWAGRFRDLLSQKSANQELASLATQVSQLSEISKTLQRYLEAMLKSGIAGDKSDQLVETERQRLELSERQKVVQNSMAGRFLRDALDQGPQEALNTVEQYPTLAAFAESKGGMERNTILDFLELHPDVVHSYSLVRKALGLNSKR
jgi:hypothetical protein